MTSLTSVEQFLSMQDGLAVLPSTEGGEPDTARIETALRQATGDTEPFDELEYFEGTTVVGTGERKDHTNMED
jgi:hypothetical protein